MTGLELVLASHLLLQQASAAAPVVCPVQKSARVDVRWRSEPIRYDHNQDFEDLAHKEINTKNPYGKNVETDVGGLMSGKIKYKSSIEISAIRYPTMQLSCLWIEKVNVEIVIEPLIQIAREHPQGSCEYIAILEHEQKHVQTDRLVVADHLQALRQAAGGAVQKVGVVGPKATASEEDYKKKMNGYVDAALKKSMDLLYADRVQRQQRIDTKAEYDRVDAKCPD